MQLILAALAVSAPDLARAACAANSTAIGTTICSYNSSNDVVTCNLAALGDSTGATAYAVYDTGLNACAEEYCVWGTDANSGANFCYEHDTSTSGPIRGIDVLGGSSADFVYFSDVVTGQHLEPDGSGNLTARALVFGGNDYVLGSTYSANDYVERFWGGDNDDTLDGDEGIDELQGEGGVDTLYGGDGRDELHGGDGNDNLYGDGDDDVCYGDAQDDVIYGGEALDLIYGGSGNDTIDGGTGADTILGEANNDTIVGNEGDDIVSGGSGIDTIYGGLGDDDLAGGPNNDTIYGGTESDAICGDSGLDTLYGDGGDDILYGAVGAGETEDGGANSDSCEGYPAAAAAVNCEAGWPSARPCAL